MARLLCLIAVAFVVPGCRANAPVNDSFPLRIADAKQALKDMRRSPRPLKRPVLVLDGWNDPGVATSHITGVLKGLSEETLVVGVSFLFTGSFDDCRARVLKEIQSALPSDDPAWTTEVDVVGVSMGGLVARYATLPPPVDSKYQRRLRIARLFTIATPHRGANLSNAMTLLPQGRLERDMRTGSPFLARLDKALAEAPYELFCYVRLGDAIVGPEHAAPPGRAPWWVPNRPLEAAHLSAHRDPRILGDIARRLRGEPPFATNPPIPLPPDAAGPTPRLSFQRTRGGP